MNKISIIGLISCALLAACGGGGSGSSPLPNPGSTKSVAFSATSLGTHTQSVVRQGITTQSSCNGSNATIVTQALANFTPPNASATIWSIGQVVQATEYDASCAVISKNPNYKGQDGTIAIVNATTDAVGNPLPSPAPGSVNVKGGNPGKDTVIATFPDGTSASVPFIAYQEIVFACPTDGWYSGSGSAFAKPAWSDAAGYNVAWTGCGGGGTTASGLPNPDIFNDEYGSSTELRQTVDVPNGYQIVKSSATTADLASVMSCSSFVSSGTSFSLNSSQFTTNNGVNGGFLLLFKTADGKCVKFLDLNREPVMAGLYEVSDTSGNFAF